MLGDFTMSLSKVNTVLTVIKIKGTKSEHFPWFAIFFYTITLDKIIIIGSM